MRKIAVSAIVVVLAAVGIFFIYVVLDRGVTQVSLHNTSSEPITRGELLALDRRFPIGQIAVGGFQTICIQNRGEGSYQLNVEFRSGRHLLSGELGYFTSGASANDQVEIQSEKILLKSTRPFRTKFGEQTPSCSSAKRTDTAR